MDPEEIAGAFRQAARRAVLDFDAVVLAVVSFFFGEAPSSHRTSEMRIYNQFKDAVQGIVERHYAAKLPISVRLIEKWSSEVCEAISKEGSAVLNFHVFEGRFGLAWFSQNGTWVHDFPIAEINEAYERMGVGRKRINSNSPVIYRLRRLTQEELNAQLEHSALSTRNALLRDIKFIQGIEYLNDASFQLQDGTIPLVRVGDELALETNPRPADTEQYRQQLIRLLGQIQTSLIFWKFRNQYSVFCSLIDEYQSCLTGDVGEHYPLRFWVNAEQISEQVRRIKGSYSVVDDDDRDAFDNFMFNIDLFITFHGAYIGASPTIQAFASHVDSARRILGDANHNKRALLAMAAGELTAADFCNGELQHILSRAVAPTSPAVPAVVSADELDAKATGRQVVVLNLVRSIFRACGEFVSKILRKAIDDEASDQLRSAIGRLLSKDVLASRIRDFFERVAGQITDLARGFEPVLGWLESFLRIILPPK